MRVWIVCLSLLVLPAVAVDLALAEPFAGPVKQGSPAVDPVARRTPADGEIEPNDDCNTAIGPLSTLTTFTGSLTEADSDWYRYLATAGEIAVFRTETTQGEQAVDTILSLYSSCTDVVAINDDGGEGEFSVVAHRFTETGLFYVVVSGFSSADVGFYTLAVDTFSLADNNTCDNAIDVMEQGLQVFEVNSCQGLNSYDPGAENCPQVPVAMTGQDLAYSVDFASGGEISVSLDATWDGAIYLVSDCVQPGTSCLAGSDQFYSGFTETLTYGVETPGRYYLIVDSDGDCGRATVTILSPAETEATSWGRLKSRYR